MHQPIVLPANNGVDKRLEELRRIDIPMMVIHGNDIPHRHELDLLGMVMPGVPEYHVDKTYNLPNQRTPNIKPSLELYISYSRAIGKDNPVDDLARRFSNYDKPNRHPNFYPFSMRLHGFYDRKQKVTYYFVLPILPEANKQFDAHGSPDFDSVDFWKKSMREQGIEV